MHVELENRILREKAKTEVVYSNNETSGGSSNLAMYKREIWPATIVTWNNNGRVLVDSLNDRSITQTLAPGTQLPRQRRWLEPNSLLLHPCGYWNSLQTSSPNENIPEFKVYASLTSFMRDNYFDWHAYFKLSSKTTPKIAAPIEIFSPEQIGTSFEEVIRTDLIASRLSCDYPINPRYVWSILKQLTDDDISFVYEATGLIRNSTTSSTKSGPTTTTSTAEPSLMDSTATMSAGIVLLPSKIDPAFIRYPNVNSLSSMSKLNIACIHREYIELLVGASAAGNNYLSISFPHLIRCESLSLVDEKSKNCQLDIKHALVIMLTCLDLSNATVRNYLNYLSQS